MIEDRDENNAIDNIFDFSDVFEEDDFYNADAPIHEGVLGAKATQAGIQHQDLQSAINGWAESLNKYAIAQSTGRPVRTPIAQYKGFAAEEYLKQTTIINAYSEGIPSYKFYVGTSGPMPDGTVLSKIDMRSDIVAYGRKWPWQKYSKLASGQVKIHNGKNPSAAYAKDMAKERYANEEFIGGAEQGINDKFHVQLGNKAIVSDSMTPEGYERLASDMKNQSVPEYEHAEEKYAQLNKINLKQAIEAGAITGAILSAVNEICILIKNKDTKEEDQFLSAVQNILYGAADGGVRGGAITGTVQAMGNVLGKEIPTNTLGAVPIMAAANVSVDFAKDLYQCFVTKTIDVDDLLCKTINNSFSSITGFGGSWAGGQIAGHLIGGSSGTIISAKTAAATGATIGSAIGPIGTIVGASIGGLLMGIGANAIIETGNKDGEDAFNECMRKIDDQVSLEIGEKLYYFADSMSELSEFRLSFKDILPCYNLISDLKEYNCHKKAIKHVHEQLESPNVQLYQEKKERLEDLAKKHQQRLEQLSTWLNKEREMLFGEYRDSTRMYISNCYFQYIEAYTVMSRDIDEILQSIDYNVTLHNRILSYIRNRNKINEDLNSLLNELLGNPEDSDIRPLVEEIIRFMQQDALLINKQFISFDEALYLVIGGRTE